jgi:hypothetical protein
LKAISKDNKVHREVQFVVFIVAVAETDTVLREKYDRDQHQSHDIYGTDHCDVPKLRVKSIASDKNGCHSGGLCCAGHGQTLVFSAWLSYNPRDISFFTEQRG